MIVLSNADTSGDAGDEAETTAGVGLMSLLMHPELLKH